jgi:hypothetical protein
MKRLRAAVPAVLSLAVMAAVVVLCIMNSHQTVHAQAIQWPNPPYSPTNVNFATASATVVAAPTAGAQCIYGLMLTNAGTAVTVTIYLDGGTTAVTSAYLAATSGPALVWPLQNNPQNPYFMTNNATAFVIKQSGTSQINGSVYAAICP